MTATSINCYTYNILNASNILIDLIKILKMATVVCKICKILYNIYHIKNTVSLSQRNSVKWKKRFLINKTNIRMNKIRKEK